MPCDDSVVGLDGFLGVRDVHSAKKRYACVAALILLEALVLHLQHSHSSIGSCNTLLLRILELLREHPAVRRARDYRHRDDGRAVLRSTRARLSLDHHHRHGCLPESSFEVGTAAQVASTQLNAPVEPHRRPPAPPARSKTCASRSARPRITGVPVGGFQLPPIAVLTPTGEQPTSQSSSVPPPPQAQQATAAAAGSDSESDDDSDAQELRGDEDATLPEMDGASIVGTHSTALRVVLTLPRLHNELNTPWDDESLGDPVLRRSATAQELGRAWACAARAQAGGSIGHYHMHLCFAHLAELIER